MADVAMLTDLVEKTNSHKRYMRDLREMPKCDASHMFLWEALDVAGRGLLGEEWTGTELNALDWKVSPYLAGQLARKASPNFPSRTTPRVTLPPTLTIPNALDLLREPAQHVADWRKGLNGRVLELRQARWEQNEAAIKRMHEAASWLHDRFRYNDVATSYRWEKGGLNLSKMEPAEWNIEGVMDRFRHGGFKRYFPHSGSHSDMFIFVDRASLEREVSKLGHAPLLVAPDDFASLPEPLRLAIRIALARPELAEAGDKERRNAVRPAWIEAYGAESETYIKAIATVLKGKPDLARIAREKERHQNSTPTKS